MPKKRILIQLDADAQPSTFDAIVAVDAGVEQLLTHGQITVENVEPLIHGAMFTRGGSDLAATAVFFGGSDVRRVEEIVTRATSCFFGPVRVSWMADPNGSNTTAAAAVLAAEQHLDLEGATATVLGGTGPVGSRIAQLAARRGAKVRLVSRTLAKAESVRDWLTTQQPGAEISPHQAADPRAALDVVTGANVLFGAGAAGVRLLEPGWEKLGDGPQVAIDLNAVPPASLGGIEVTDKAHDREGRICYGAIGVGGIKMKIHRRCLQQLFEANDHEFDTVAIYECGRQLLAPV